MFKQTLVVFTGQPNIEEELLLFIICLFVEFMRFNSYAAKLKKKTKIAHKSWPIRKKNYLRDPKKSYTGRIIQTMPKNIISEIEVLVLIYNEIKYLLAVTIIRVEKLWQIFEIRRWRKRMKLVEEDKKI